MSKKDKQNQAPAQDEVLEEQGAQPAPEAAPGAKAEEKESDPLLEELEALKDQTAQQEDKYLRLAAEYDNYRKRTAREKPSAKGWR